MSEKVLVALDAMGGDYSPEQQVLGAVNAVKEEKDLKVFLVGIEKEIKAELAKYDYPADQLEIVPATEVITNNEMPTKAIREKKDSSIVVGLKMVKEGKADAFVSSGCTGAVLVGGQFIVGRIKGIKRTPLAPLIPTKTGVSLLIDCGANVDARPEHLVQFAKMGSIYYQNVVGKEKPTVGIVNIGAEEEKGNQLVKDTFPRLKECKDINFIGNVEAREIPEGNCDVIVTEAFVGNVILKLMEGLANTLVGEIKKSFFSNLRSKLGALLVKPALKKTLKRFDTSAHGGAPMLGLNGLVVKAHGNATHKETKNAIMQCITFKKQNVKEQFLQIVEKGE